MIYLSAGHFFGDPGAINATGVKEADLTMELRSLIAAELTKLGASFVLDKDTENLSQYISRIKPGSGSVVCDIHFNAGQPTANGVETLVKTGANHGENLLAAEINKVLVDVCGLRNRGVKTEADSHRGRLGILHTAAGISVLPEICFISNVSDLGRYQGKKEAVAKGIAAALKKYDDLYK